MTVLPNHPQQSTWDAVDRALEAWLAPQDDALLAATQSAARAGLPEVAVSPAQGRLLEVLARAIGARRILELGTLAGFSTIWLARALPAGGTLVTLELEPERARISRENVDRAGCGGAVEIMVGPAMRSLETLRAAGAPPFDLVFIDADKENCPGYLEHALALSRPGTLVIVDNAIRRGRLIDARTGDASVDGVRAMMEVIARDPRLAAAGVQTVGAKGYDGFVMLVVGENAATTAPYPQPGDPLDSMLAHDVWATREVLRACAALDDGAWWDLGSRSEYLAVHAALAGKGAPWISHCAGVARTAKILGATAIGTGAEIGAGAMLQDCIIWQNATVVAGSRLTRCIIADGATASGEHTDVDFAAQ